MDYIDIAFLAGRIIFGGYFLMNAYNHIVKNAGLVGYAASMGVPSPKLAVVGSGFLLLVGGLSIVLGYMPLIGVIALVLFLLPVSFKAHAFWKAADPMVKMNEKIAFMKNMAIIGAALMLLAIPTPWVLSIS